jgi:phenylpropionate dioxygenase-like ring-hydroxylating dioxygenase large terminal subunit
MVLPSDLKVTLWMEAPMFRDGAVLSELVVDDDRDFRIHTRLYTDASLFEVEMQSVFERTWNYVGHESEVPDPGNYKTTTIGTQPIIVSRHEDGRLYVLLNRCRHRGAVVCRVDSGHSNFFRCPYHNWVYRNDGALVGMSQASGYPEDFDKSSHGLQPVPRVGSYRGLVFANMAEDGSTLDDHLAPVKRYIDAWLDRSPVGDIEMVPPPHRYPYAGNWKWQAENGADGYHGNYVHQSWQKVLERAEEAPVREIKRYREGGCTRGMSNGHGLLERPGGLNPGASWTGRMMKMFPEYAEALNSKFSEREIDDISARRNIFVFPNIYLFDTHIRVIRPVSVDYTEVTLNVYALKGVPDELNEGRYRAHERFYGPSGFGSPDDIEIFVSCQTGLRATGMDWVLLNRGQHREKTENGERIGHSTDETPTRSIYREWKRLMADGEATGESSAERPVGRLRSMAR